MYKGTYIIGSVYCISKQQDANGKSIKPENCDN